MVDGRGELAAQLAQHLQHYEKVLEVLAVQGWSTAAYAELSVAFDAARQCARDWPQAGMAWALLVVHHFELAHALWMLQGRMDEAGERLLQEHRGLLRMMREHCRSAGRPPS